MPPKDHPIWPIVTYVVRMSALGLLLWLNASDFDTTEITTWVMYGLADPAVGVTRKLAS